MSILDDMREAALAAAECDHAHVWRIGANAWDAFRADLFLQGITADPETFPTKFLSYPVERVLDHRAPTGWELRPV